MGVIPLLQEWIYGVKQYRELDIYYYHGNFRWWFIKPYFFPQWKRCIFVGLSSPGTVPCHSLTCPFLPSNSLPLLAEIKEKWKCVCSNLFVSQQKLGTVYGFSNKYTAGYLGLGQNSSGCHSTGSKGRGLLECQQSTGSCRRTGGGLLAWLGSAIAL